MRPINYIVLSLVAVCALSCDFKKCDLTITNSTGEEIYFITHPYKLDTLFIDNIAYMYNISHDPNLPERYLNFEDNPQSLLPGEIVQDCIINTSFRRIAKEYRGLTIVAYRRQHLEIKEPNVLLTGTDVFVKTNLTLKELDDLAYKVILK